MKYNTWSVFCFLTTTVLACAVACDNAGSSSQPTDDDASPSDDDESPSDDDASSTDDWFIAQQRAS